MFGFTKTKDDIKGQEAAVEWLRASVLTETGPAFMWSDKRKCELVLAYIDRLSEGKPESEVTK